MRTKLTLFENFFTVTWYKKKSKIKFTITSVTYMAFCEKSSRVNKAALVPHLKPSFYDSTFDKIMALFLQSLVCVTSGMILIVRLRAVIVFSRHLAFAENTFLNFLVSLNGLGYN